MSLDLFLEQKPRQVVVRTKLTCVMGGNMSARTYGAFIVGAVSAKRGSRSAGICSNARCSCAVMGTRCRLSCRAQKWRYLVVTQLPEERSFCRYLVSCAKSTEASHVLYYVKLTFFPEYKTFLFRPRVFCRALGCGERRGPDCTPRCKCGSRPGSVARVLGVQSREIWQVTTASLSDQLEPFRPVQTPKT